MKALDILLTVVRKDIREHDIVSGASYITLKNNGRCISVLKGELKYYCPLKLLEQNKNRAGTHNEVSALLV